MLAVSGGFPYPAPLELSTDCVLPSASASRQASFQRKHIIFECHLWDINGCRGKADACYGGFSEINVSAMSPATAQIKSCAVLVRQAPNLQPVRSHFMMLRMTLWMWLLVQSLSLSKLDETQRGRVYTLCIHSRFQQLIQDCRVSHVLSSVSPY